MQSNSDDPDVPQGKEHGTTSRLSNLFKRKRHDKQTSAVTNSGSPAVSIEQGLEKTRGGILNRLGDVFKGNFDLDDELFDELEEVLISSDIGVEASLRIVSHLKKRVKREKIQDADGVIDGLRTEISIVLQDAESAWPLLQSEPASKPYVLVIVGVNGVGKTTTTAKIAGHFLKHGKTVMLAAADTFRAAAVAQLQDWGARLDVPVIAQQQGADAAAVAHDALTAAISRNIDILMIDTAGRLHTQSDLMEQLKKVVRVLRKIDPSCPHEVMQVLDAGTGQNALQQVEHFHQAVDVSSLCLTKLDGSARGGLALALTEKFKLPIRFVGVGEGFDDLRSFKAEQFAQSLIAKSNLRAKDSSD